MQPPPHNLQQVNDLPVVSGTPAGFRGLEGSMARWVMVTLAAIGGTLAGGHRFNFSSLKVIKMMFSVNLVTFILEDIISHSDDG